MSHQELEVKYKEITKYVMDLIGVGNHGIANLIGAYGVPEGIAKLDVKLKEILDNIEEYTTAELTCWLRNSYKAGEKLVSGKPLLEQAKKQAN